MNRHPRPISVVGPVNYDCPLTRLRVLRRQADWLREQIVPPPQPEPEPEASVEADYTAALELQAANAAERRELDAAAELVTTARQQLDEARRSIRQDRYLNASGAAGLLAWTTYCLEWSHVPHPAIGGFLLVAGWAAFYHYRGRRWLHGA